MSDLTKSDVENLRVQLQQVLDNAGISNFDFDIGSIRYSSTDATIQLKAKVKGQKSREEIALIQYAKSDGIDPTKVSARGERLVEYHTRKRKYPYIMVNKNGARYKLSTAEAKRRFAKSA